MFKLLILLCFYWSAATYAASSTPKLAPCDAWFPAQGAAKGVILLTHGLNLKPSRMDDLARAFSANGFEVFRPAFTGHCNDNKKYVNLNPAEWEADARRFHAIAQARAREFGVPLFLCAYSFSTAVFQVLSNELPFAKRIYFAPALATYFWYPTLVWLARLWPSLSYPTMIPEGYYANASGNLSSLIAFDSFEERWKGGEGKNDPTPILAWIDPDDELVSARGLAELAAKRTNWSLRMLSVAGGSHPKKYRHLVIDEAALGAVEWKRVTREIQQFLGPARR